MKCGPPVIDYASAAVQTTRYSLAAVGAFVFSTSLALLAIDAGAMVTRLPWWVLLALPATGFASNYAAAIHLLEARDDLRGDALVCWGGMISGIMTMIAMFLWLMSL